MEGEGESVKEGKRERGRGGIPAEKKEGRMGRGRQTDPDAGLHGWSRVSAGPAAAQKPKPDKMETRAGSRMSGVASQMLNESSKSRGKRKALIPVVAPLLKAECPVHSPISPLSGWNQWKRF